jgi:hypothetical protein
MTLEAGGLRLEAKGRRQKAECRRQDEADGDNVSGLLSLYRHGSRNGHVIGVKGKR